MQIDIIMTSIDQFATLINVNKYLKTLGLMNKTERANHKDCFQRQTIKWILSRFSNNSSNY